MVGAGPNDVRLARMPIRPPVDALGVRQGSLVLAVDANYIELQPFRLLPIAAEDYPLAIGRDKRPAVIARGIGELFHIRSIGVHEIDIGIAIPVAAKGNQLAVLGPGSFSVVSLVIGKVADDTSVEICLEDICVWIEVPLVTPPYSRLFILFNLFSFGCFGFCKFGVEMARRKQNAPAIGRETAACRPAAACGDQLWPP